MALAQKKLNSSMVEANSSIADEDEWHRAGTHEVYAGDYDDDYPEDWDKMPPSFFVGVKNAFLISMAAVLAFLAGMYGVIYIAARFGGR